MVEFFDSCTCEFCNQRFEWKYIKPKNGSVVMYWIDSTMNNVKDFSENNYQYIVKLQCPNCFKNQFVTINK